jgi:hypothetical protein
VVSFVLFEVVSAASAEQQGIVNRKNMPNSMLLKENRVVVFIVLIVLMDFGCKSKE